MPYSILGYPEITAEGFSRLLMDELTAPARCESLSRMLYRESSARLLAPVQSLSLLTLLRGLVCVLDEFRCQADHAMPSGFLGVYLYDRRTAQDLGTLPGF